MLPFATAAKLGLPFIECWGGCGKGPRCLDLQPEGREREKTPHLEISISRARLVKKRPLPFLLSKTSILAATFYLDISILLDQFNDFAYVDRNALLPFNAACGCP